MNKNERHGKIDQAKGKLKQAVGTLTRNDQLKVEGQVDQVVGKFEATVGQAQRKAADAIDKVGKAAKG